MRSLDNMEVNIDLIRTPTKKSTRSARSKKSWKRSGSRSPTTDLPRDVTLTVSRPSTSTSVPAPPGPGGDDCMSPIRQSKATVARMAKVSSARTKYIRARARSAHDDYRRDADEEDEARPLTTKEDNDYRITRDTFLDVTEEIDKDQKIDVNALNVEESGRRKLADSFQAFLSTGNRNVLTDTIYETSVDSGINVGVGQGGWQEAPLDQDLYRRAADAVARGDDGTGATAYVGKLLGLSCYIGGSADDDSAYVRHDKGSLDDEESDGGGDDDQTEDQGCYIPGL